MYTRYLVSPWLLVIAFALASCGGENARRAQFQEGMEAYGQGDFATAMQKWRPLADSGDPAAQTNIGFLHWEGKGVSLNYEEAVRWYKMAAVQGYPDALFNLGVAYTEGKGVPRNPGEARNWYRLAANEGYTPAQV